MGDDLVMEFSFNISSPPLIRPVPEILKAVENEKLTVSEVGSGSGRMQSSNQIELSLKGQKQREEGKALTESGSDPGYSDGEAGTILNTVA